MRIVAFVLIAVGILLFIGNESGAFATFPFAGFIVGGLGGPLLKADDMGW